MLTAPTQVAAQSRDGRGVQRQQPALAEFAVADHQRAMPQIEIAQV
jgi:hypothetical protein